MCDPCDCVCVRTCVPCKCVIRVTVCAPVCPVCVPSGSPRCLFTGTRACPPAVPPVSFYLPPVS